MYYYNNDADDDDDDDSYFNNVTAIITISVHFHCLPVVVRARSLCFLKALLKRNFIVFFLTAIVFASLFSRTLTSL